MLKPICELLEIWIASLIQTTPWYTNVWVGEFESYSMCCLMYADLRVNHSVYLCMLSVNADVFDWIGYNTVCTCVHLRCEPTYIWLESLNFIVHLCMPSVYADLYATGEVESYCTPVYACSVCRPVCDWRVWVDEYTDRWSWTQHWDAAAIHCQSDGEVCACSYVYK